jgi:predicted nuclease with TOPRIM domain
MSDWNDLATPEKVGGIGGAMLALAIAAKSLTKRWKSDTAETEVIDMLRAEVLRLSAQNIDLATKLNSLQVELVTLNSELARMTIENNALHGEVKRLTVEVTRLQSVRERSA